LIATLTVLDVGHGNSAVISGPDGVVVVDAGPGGGDLLQYLKDERISVLDCVVLSHADEDHIRGLLGVLGEPSIIIRQVLVNANAIQGTVLWEDLVWELAHQDQNEALDYQPACVAGTRLHAVAPEVSIDVVGPAKALAGHGPGWKDAQGRVATANSCSVVVRIDVGEQPVALLPGDIDEMGFEYLEASAASLKAPILVFPHHGGHVRPGATDAVNETYTAKVLEAIEPSHVLFSLGRGRHGTPRGPIVDKVRNTGAVVACTQLSDRCSASLPEKQRLDLLPVHAQGRDRRVCCAGTIRVDLSTSPEPQPGEEYLAFRTATFGARLCK
jgi:beta-lactamase superfamily II metal-dependent hydrolase